MSDTLRNCDSVTFDELVMWLEELSAEHKLAIDTLRSIASKEYEHEVDVCASDLATIALSKIDQIGGGGE